MRAARRAGCSTRALVLAAVAACARAELAITSGAHAGLTLSAASYTFSEASGAPAATAGELVLAEADAWTAGCPPVYSGHQPLRGKIVVHANPPFSTLCTAASYAAGAADAGALGYVQYDDMHALIGSVPGWDARAFAEFDGHAPLAWPLPPDPRRTALAPIVAADARSPALTPVITALRAGALVHARLRPARGEFEALWDSVAWGVWCAVMAAQALAVVELVACRLYALARADGGVCRAAGRWRYSSVHALALVLLMVNVYRVGYFVIDPLHSRGVFSVAFNLLLISCDDSVAASGSTLFLLRLAAGARDAGVGARCALARRRPRRALMAAAFANITLDFVTSLAFFWAYEMHWTILRFFVVSVAFPFALVLLALSTERAVTRELRARQAGADESASRASLAAVRRTVAAARVYAGCRVLGLAAQLVFWSWGMYTPHRMPLVVLVHMSALIWSSYAQAEALLPPAGVHVPRGPLRALIELAVPSLALSRAPQAAAGTASTAPAHASGSVAVFADKQ